MRTIKKSCLACFIIGLTLIGTYNKSFAQLSVTPGMGITPQQLVQSVLVGSGVVVSNATFNGSAGPITWNTIGSFTTGMVPTNLGFSSGLILASGGVTGAPGPNNSGGYTLAVSPTTPIMTDADLLAVVGSSVTSLKDAAVLEFDFIPSSDTIRFRYVFGSDEYPEYINGYNDVFAFFITGQNPFGPAYNKKNIALIPGTTTPVSIYNVNNGTTNSGPCVHCAYYINNTGGSGIQADGFTTVLTAVAAVVPCTTYHLKLAIADANDQVLDSWVFLEANSLSTNVVKITTNYTTVGAAPMAIEGCNDAIVKFTIPLVKTDTVVLPLLITGTAINGVDYTHIPDTVYILPGQTSTTLLIHPIVDYIAEPIETIYLKVKDTTTCTLIGDSTLIRILSRDSIKLVTCNDTAICQDKNHSISTPISVVSTGGANIITYTWTPAVGLSSDTVTNPLCTPALTVNGEPTSTLYLITVNDNTGCIGAVDSVRVTANPSPDVSFQSEPSLTATGCVPLNVKFIDESTPHGSVRTWSFGDGTTSNDSAAIHVYSIPGSYDIKLGIVTAGGCKGEFTYPSGVIVYPQPKADFTWDPAVGTRTNPSITFKNLTQPDDPSFIYSWDFGDLSPIDNQKNPVHKFPNLEPVVKEYKVTLTSTTNFGCNDTIDYTVKIVNDILIFPNIMTPNGDGMNDKFFVAALTDGGAFTEAQLIIYNRWGKKVYENNNYKNDFGGEGLADGVYYFTFRAKGLLLNNLEYKGSLQILR
ncbi:MAG: choice-of-anchor L domain-containing protein [Bacteroidetes bacterium]|nr:choice-of-anchor L domain-containing protein [Bacteroidota bacterium]